MKKNRFGWMGFLLVLSVLFSAYPLFASCKRMTYEESQDSAYRKACRKGSTFPKDNNVWVYSAAMRKRFGMPLEWMDEGLTGAGVVALRLEPVGRDRCHGKGAAQKCVPSWEWVVDIYIDSKVDIGIKGDLEVEFVPWKSSLWHLGELNPELKAKWEQKFGLKEVKLEVGDGDQDYRFKVIGYNKTKKRYLTVVTALMDGRAVDLAPQVSRRIVFGGSGHVVRLPPLFWERAQSYEPVEKGLTALNWQGGQERDNNLWAATAGFARQYRLPEESIVTEGLEGALAVAYHIEPEGWQRCGYFSRQDACGKPYWKGKYDFYIPTDAELPYVDDKPMNAVMRGLSNTLLKEQYEENEFSLKPCQQNRWDHCWLGGFLKQVLFTFRAESWERNKWGIGGGLGTGPSYVIRPSLGPYPFHFMGMPQGVNDSLKGDSYYIFLNERKYQHNIENPLTDKRVVYRLPIPPDYLMATQRIRSEYKKRAGSVVDLVAKEYGWKKPGANVGGSTATCLIDTLNSN